MPLLVLQICFVCRMLTITSGQRVLMKSHIAQGGVSTANKNKNSSGDETANVNFFYDDIFNHFAQSVPEASQFGEITQSKHYAVKVI